MTDSGTYLLDVNVLVALAWPNHVAHRAVRHWVSTHRGTPMASCPLTELGFVRVSMNPLVVGEQVSLPAALELLGRYKDGLLSHFWPDDLPASALAPLEVAGHRQVTAGYLLALAVAHGGTLVTLDTGIRALASPEQLPHLLVIDAL